MRLERKKKFYVGDVVTYRLNNSNQILTGEIVEAPKEYACDSDMPNIGDFYIILQGRKEDIPQGETGFAYVVNSRDIYET